MSNNAEIVGALRAAGLNVKAPADIARQGAVVEVQGAPRPVKLYSWSVDDNGTATGVERPADERRIQAIASKTQRIDVEAEPEGLVLGWSKNFTSAPVIVAFNPYGVANRANGKVERKLRSGAEKARASDSQQFRQSLLNEAMDKGLSIARNQHGEYVLAFRPGRFVEYLAQLKPRYHTQSNAEAGPNPGSGMEDLVAEAEREISEPADGEDQSEPGFDPDNLADGRERVAREIAVRRGQASFRANLLANYRCCVITGCETVSVLEAAHIVPYKGPGSNHISNGLLLRADIHTLFDLGLLAVDEASLQVLVSTRLNGTEYEGFRGRSLKIERATHRPSTAALKIHRAQALV